MKKVDVKVLTTIPTQMDVVVLAIYFLGGAGKAIDTEDVAVKCSQISPGTFSWRKYPDQINLELVRVTLSDAKKSKYGSLLAGSGRDGWRLTNKGIDWVAAKGGTLSTDHSSLVSGQRRNAGSIDTVRKNREKQRLVTSEVWQRWRKNEPVAIRDAELLFRIDDYAGGEMRERKIVRLRAMFEGDPEVEPFVRSMTTLVLRAKEEK